MKFKIFMPGEIIQQLKLLKREHASPRADWVMENRARLLSQIKNTVPVAPAKFSVGGLWPALSIFMPQGLVYGVVRPLLVVVLAVAVVTSGWAAAADAAHNALPGDLFYAAKRVAEKTQVAAAALVGGEKSEVKVRAGLAKKRADEVKQVINNPEKKDKVTVAVADLKDEINNVNSKLESIKNNGEDAAKEVKDVKTETENIGLVLASVKEDLLVSATGTDKLLSQEVAAVKDLVKETEVKAMEVMVSKHLEGDTSVTKDEVKQAIGSTLASAVGESEKNKQNAAEVQKIMEAVKANVGEIAAVVAPVVGSSTAAVTKDLTQKIGAVQVQTTQAAADASKANSEVTKRADEARQLLSTDDLAKAIDKVKEANVAAKEVEKISDKTLEAVRQVAPAVSVVSVVKEESASSTLITGSSTLAAPVVSTSIVTTPAMVSGTVEKK